MAPNGFLKTNRFFPASPKNLETESKYTIGQLMKLWYTNIILLVAVAGGSSRAESFVSQYRFR